MYAGPKKSAGLFVRRLLCINPGGQVGQRGKMLS